MLFDYIKQKFGDTLQKIPHHDGQTVVEEEIDTRSTYYGKYKLDYNEERFLRPVDGFEDVRFTIPQLKRIRALSVKYELNKLFTQDPSRSPRILFDGYGEVTSPVTEQVVNEYAVDICKVFTHIVALYDRRIRPRHVMSAIVDDRYEDILGFVQQAIGNTLASLDYPTVYHRDTKILHRTLIREHILRSTDVVTDFVLHDLSNRYGFDVDLYKLTLGLKDLGLIEFNEKMNAIVNQYRQLSKHERVNPPVDGLLAVLRNTKSVLDKHYVPAGGKGGK